MSVEFCTRCSNHVDTDYNVEGIYVDGEYVCSRHTCDCGEHMTERGYELCRACLVALVEESPIELEGFLDRAEILVWIAEARAKRERAAVTHQPGFLSRRQAGS